MVLGVTVNAWVVGTIQQHHNNQPMERFIFRIGYVQQVFVRRIGREICTTINAAATCVEMPAAVRSDDVTMAWKFDDDGMMVRPRSEICDRSTIEIAEKDVVG